MGGVLEAPEPHPLADFYSCLLGWPVMRTEPTGAAIQVRGTSSYLSFSRSPDYVPPAWPAAEGHQQMMMMMHIDIAVKVLADAVADAIQHGATLAAFQPQDNVRVLLDPAGHPYCLYLDQ